MIAQVLFSIAGIIPSPAPDPAPWWVPPWVVRGIAQVETGSSWDPEEGITHYRHRQDGAAGEVGPWQMTPEVLRDLDESGKRSRLRSDRLMAESLFRKHILRLRAVTGSWKGAVSAYHRGLGGRLGPDGLQYYRAVWNVGHAR